MRRIATATNRPRPTDHAAISHPTGAAIGASVPGLVEQRGRAGRRQVWVEAPLDGAGHPVDEQEGDQGGHRQEQVQGQQRGADAAECGTCPGEPAVTGQHRMAAPHQQARQRGQPQHGGGDAAPDHAEEHRVVQLGEGAQRRVEQQQFVSPLNLAEIQATRSGLRGAPQRTG
jgi:hypothetical protein